MSIQPNRVLARIVEQVDRSDWPRLESRVRSSQDGSEWLRVYLEPSHPRYATPIHFWVHALREELSAGARREDLVSAAGHALCRRQSLAEWRTELGPGWLSRELEEASGEVYRMLESECRRSSVAGIGDRLIAHFWGHGPGPSWRRETQ